MTTEGDAAPNRSSPDAPVQPEGPAPGPHRSRPQRLHDLDALRGFAMLLGIGLHASLAFFPTFWPAQDSTSSWDGPYDELLHAVHGFRMPLFFLLSGFFTAMLWRRRGLRALVEHRLRRIALPLALGVVTIVPAVNWAAGWAIDNGVGDYVAESGDIWTATLLGNEKAVEALLDDGFDVDAANLEDKGHTALHMAAVTNDAEIAQLLLGRGADPNKASTDGTPTDYAVFFGHEEVADLLVAAGAVDPRPPGARWQDIPFWAAGTDLLDEIGEQLGLDSWLASFHHLWFLWFLLWLVAGFAVIALAVERFGSEREAPAAWSGRVMWALVPLTLVPQLAMGNGGETQVFGPDTSTGLLPIPHVIVYYAVFFAFGALLYGRRDAANGLLVETIGRWWKVVLPVTILVVLPLALGLTFTEEQAWGLAAIAQVVYTWAMIVGLMGLFRAILARERRGVRYLSDSSYWLYLAHVPLVILAQSVIRDWDLPSGVKFVGLTLLVSLFLLATYQLFVRYSPLGTLLNGKRTRPQQPAQVEAGAG